MSFTQAQQQQFMGPMDESLVSFLDSDAALYCDFSSSGSTCSTEFTNTDSDDSLSSLLFSSQLGDECELGFEFATCDWDVSSPMPVAQSLESQQQLQQSKPLRKNAPAKKTAVVIKTPADLTATTKRPRKHNRIEIIKLREQVEELEARQAKLQKFRSDRQQQLHTTQQPDNKFAISVSVSVAAAAAQHATTQSGTKLRKTAKGAKAVTTATVSAAPRSVWFDLAVEQYRGLQDSKTLNRKLRDAVAKQLKVTNSFQALLQKKVSSQDLDLLLAIPHPPASMQQQLLSPYEQQITELCATMEHQFLETDLVSHRLATANDTSSVFSNSQVRVDPLYGPTFELMTNTPVANSFHLLGVTMWNRIIEKKGLPVVNPPPRRAQKTPSLLAFHDKHMQMTVASKLGELLVDGTVAISKFEEPHRVVITIASTYTVSESCIVLREHAWIIVSDTTRFDDETAGCWSVPVRSALFQTFYRLHSEKQDLKSPMGSSPFSEKVLDDETAYVQEVVMKSLGDKMRQHMMQLQTSLLSEVGGLATYLSESNLNCPMLECAA